MMGRLFVADFNYFVKDLSIQDRRNKAGADSLDFVITGFSSGNHRRSCRFHGANPHALHLLFQHFADSGNCSAGAHAGDERVDAFKLLQ